MPSRVESLLAELQARHGNSAEFFAQLRPAIERILDDGTPAEARPHLLELVAETCERDLEIRAGSERLRAALRAMFDDLADRVRKLGPQ